MHGTHRARTSLTCNVPYLSKEIKPLGLSVQEKADLVAFLQALSCPDLQVVAPTLRR